MFNKIWNFWNDMKVPLGIIVGFTVVLAFYGWWWLVLLLYWPFTAGGGLPLALRRLDAFTGMPDGSFTAKKCSLTATLIPLCVILSVPAIMP